MNDNELYDYMRLIALNACNYGYDEAMDILDVVTDMYGYNEDTLDTANYVLTGYRNYSQLLELEGGY